MKLYTKKEPIIIPDGVNDHDSATGLLNVVAIIILTAGLIAGAMSLIDTMKTYSDLYSDLDIIEIDVFLRGFLSAMNIWIPTLGFFAILEGMSALIRKLGRIQTQGYTINNLDISIDNPKENNQANKRKVYFCTGCGKEYSQKPNFCDNCGSGHIEEKYI